METLLASSQSIIPPLTEASFCLNWFCRSDDSKTGALSVILDNWSLAPYQLCRIAPGKCTSMYTTQLCYKCLQIFQGTSNRPNQCPRTWLHVLLCTGRNTARSVMLKCLPQPTMFPRNVICHHIQTVHFPAIATPHCKSGQRIDYVTTNIRTSAIRHIRRTGFKTGVKSYMSHL